MDFMELIPPPVDMNLGVLVYIEFYYADSMPKYSMEPFPPAGGWVFKITMRIMIEIC